MNQKKPWYKNWIVWVAIVIVLGVIGMFMPKSDEQKQKEEEVQEQIADAQARAEEAAQEAEQVAQEAQAQQENTESLPAIEDLIAKTNETNAPQTAQAIIDKYPEVVEAIVNNDGEKNILVIHAEYPDGGWSNEDRIKGTFLLTEKLVKNDGAGAVDELQFWAAEPLVDSITGEKTEPQKVISFTIGKDAMKGILNGVTYASDMMEKEGVLQDLWIHPALQSE